MKEHRGGETVAAVATGDPATARYGLMLWTAALTGLASFVYEIAWIRMLSLVLGSSTHSFELMLSAFITGLAFGGLWIKRRIDTITDPLRYLGKVQVVMGLLALSTVALYGGSFDVMRTIMAAVSQTEPGYLLFNVASHAVAIGIMFPTTFCAGMTLPLITYSLLRRGVGEKSIGVVYATNTVGAIGGVIAATHVGMPLLGLKGLIAFGASVDLALGVVLVTVAAGSFHRRLPRLSAAVGVAGLGATLLFVHLDRLKMASGVYRRGALISPERGRNVFHRDGKTSSVDLVEYRSGRLVLFTNGKAEASINMRDEQRPANDEFNMVLTGIIPLAVFPQAETAAVIGLGSGQTSHAMLGSRSLRVVDTIEIEASVTDAARRFGPRVERVFRDSRSRIHIDDAKAFLSSRGSTYDIIVAEPSNPWVSGVSSLFSVEFYTLMQRHLSADGVFAQWLQLYEIEPHLVASVMQALTRSFDDYAIYATGDVDILIVATNGSTASSLDPRVFDHPLLAADLRRLQIRSVGDLALRRIADRELLEPPLRIAQGARQFRFLSVPRSQRGARALSQQV